MRNIFLIFLGLFTFQLNAQFGKGDKSKVLDNYSFAHQVTMQIESTNSKGKNESLNNIKMYLNKNNDYFAAELEMKDSPMGEGKGFSIFDKPNNIMVTLMEGMGMKMGMVLNVDYEKDIEKENNQTFEKTGNKKEILGYSCEEYLFEDDKSFTTVWISNSDDLNIVDAFNAMSSDKNASSKSLPSGVPKGMMMETNTTNKKSKEVVTMKVIDIQKNINKSVATSGYQFF